MKERDWSSALIEVLIVVVGIFIGLQVDDWNQARKDRIDEKDFMLRLHDDVLLADELSRRLRHRRIERLVIALDASDVLFNRGDTSQLTAEQCGTIVWSTAFNMTASELPSVDELIGTGRMAIIRDAELRTSLVALRQTRAALDAVIVEKTASDNFRSLTAEFPELFQMEPYVDEDMGEVRTRNVCDLEGMRSNRAFLNQFSANVDGYDAYIRDGVKPWTLQFDRVHKLVDAALGIEHPQVAED